MGVNSVIFANTRAYSAIGNLLTEEKYARLMDCSTSAELKKVLLEFGYSGDTLDEIFSLATDGIYAYIKDGSAVPAVGKAIALRIDYHNAKVMAKCKYARREITPDLLLKNGEVDVGRMKDCVLNDEYALLPVPMKEALEEIDLKFSQGERSGRVVDSALTKAMYKDILSTLGGKYVEYKEIVMAEIDMLNVSVALRVNKNGDDSTIFDNEFIVGGTIAKDKFKCILDDKDKNVASVFYGNKYDKIILSAVEESSASAFVDFEKAVDNVTIALLKKYKGDNTHYMAFYGYALARLYELKNIRIVCAGVKAGADKEDVKRKLRDLYV